MGSDIKNLEKQLAKLEQDKENLNQQISAKQRSGAVIEGASGAADIPSFKVGFKMNLISEEGAYNLILDS
jgi:prophage antirepressor-like protein